MAYAPTTDFLALLRTTAGGVRTERMPGLDWEVEALARAGLITLVVGQSPPIVNQATTAWLKPAIPSWSQEGVLFLWNTATLAYEVATPALWSLYVSQQPDPATAVPLMDATPGLVGVSVKYAREDHVHPTDTTRAPLNSPSLTGVPLSTTPANGDNSTKIATTAFVAANSGFPVEIGSIVAYVGATAPNANWIIMTGQAVLRTGATAALFALCGITYGAGDGVTTFNVPDLRGRVIAGVDGGINRLTAATMTSQARGGTGGAEVMPLSLANLPTGITSNNASQSITVTAAGNICIANAVWANTSGNPGVNTMGYTTGSIGNQAPAISGNNAISVTSNNTSGTSHNNVQPTIELNYILRIS